MLKHNPRFWSNFCFCATYIHFLELLCFAENTIKIVFSAEHSLCVSLRVKALLYPHSKTLICQKGVEFFVLPLSLKPLVYSVVCFCEEAEKLPKTMITKMPSSPPSKQNNVLLFLQTSLFVDLIAFCPSLKKHIFFLLFFCLCVSLASQHKHNNPEIAHQSLRDLIVEILTIFRDASFAPIRYLCDCIYHSHKTPQKRQNWQNIGPESGATLGPDIGATPPSWTRYWLYSTHT